MIDKINEGLFKDFSRTKLTYIRIEDLYVKFQEAIVFQKQLAEKCHSNITFLAFVTHNLVRSQSSRKPLVLWSVASEITVGPVKHASTLVRRASEEFCGTILSFHVMW